MTSYTLWKESILDKLDISSNINITSGNISSIKWLIEELSRRGTPFKVISLGAGVRRVTTQTDICSKCNGTGRC